MIDGSFISNDVDLMTSSRRWTISALPENSSFTARWNDVMFSASYVKLSTSTSVTIAHRYARSEPLECLASRERHGAARERTARVVPIGWPEPLSAGAGRRHPGPFAPSAALHLVSDGAARGVTACSGSSR